MGTELAGGTSSKEESADSGGGGVAGSWTVNTWDLHLGEGACPEDAGNK